MIQYRCCANCHSFVTPVERVYLKENLNVNHLELQDQNSSYLKALLVMFKLNWNLHKSLRSKTIKNKNKLILCPNCSQSLTQLYNSFISFAQLANDAAHLHPITSLQQNTLKESNQSLKPKLIRKLISEKELLSNFRQPQLILPKIDQIDPHLLDSELEFNLLKVKVEIEETLEENSKEEIKTGLRKSARKFYLFKRKRLKYEGSEEDEHKYIPKNFEKKIREKRAKLFKCNEKDCSSEFSSQACLLNHTIRAHAEQSNNEIECSVCFIKFNSPTALNLHQSLEHVPSVRLREFECEICNKKLISKAVLVKHIERHSAGLKYPCEACEKKFGRPQDLTRHFKLVHEKIKEFFCSDPTCGKGFAFKWQLINHESFHTEDKKFFCTKPGCAKKFKTVLNLRQHLEYHSGKKYLCPFCGVSYSRNAYLQIHLKSVHLNLPVPPSHRAKMKRAKSPSERRAKLNKMAQETIIFTGNDEEEEEEIVEEIGILEESIVTDFCVNDLEGHELSEKNMSEEEDQENYLTLNPFSEFMSLGQD